MTYYICWHLSLRTKYPLMVAGKVRKNGKWNVAFFNQLLNSAMESCHSLMVIGDLCKMDLSPLFRVLLYRRLMAKSTTTNLFLYVTEGLQNRPVQCLHVGQWRPPLSSGLLCPEQAHLSLQGVFKNHQAPSLHQ